MVDSFQFVKCADRKRGVSQKAISEICQYVEIRNDESGFHQQFINGVERS
jgi:hypothetical protein